MFKTFDVVGIPLVLCFSSPHVKRDHRGLNSSSWHLGPPDGRRSNELQVSVVVALLESCCTCSWVVGVYMQPEVIGKLQMTQPDS